MSTGTPLRSLHREVRWLASRAAAKQKLVLKPASEFRKMYAAKCVTPDGRIVIHYAAGGRAAQSLFTFKLLGYPKVKIYIGLVQ